MSEIRSEVLQLLQPPIPDVLRVTSTEVQRKHSGGRGGGLGRKTADKRILF